MGVACKTNSNISNRNIVMRLCQNEPLEEQEIILKVIKSTLLSKCENEEMRNITADEWVKNGRFCETYN